MSVMGPRKNLMAFFDLRFCFVRQRRRDQRPKLSRTAHTAPSGQSGQAFKSMFEIMIYQFWNFYRMDSLRRTRSLERILLQSDGYKCAVKVDGRELFQALTLKADFSQKRSCFAV